MISNKQAEGIMDFFWKPSSGPAENILGLVEYGYMFLGGFWGKMALSIATLMGVSLRDLGRKLDGMLHLTSIKDLANAPDNIDAEALFKSSMPQYRALFNKNAASTDKRTAFEMLFGGAKGSGGFFKMLKGVAGKILTSGLLSFLTLEGIQAAKKSSRDANGEGPSPSEDTNNTAEKEIEGSKSSLESAIRNALTT